MGHELETLNPLSHRGKGENGMLCPAHLAPPSQQVKWGPSTLAQLAPHYLEMQYV